MIAQIPKKSECHEARDTSRLSSRSWPLLSWHSLFFPNHIKMFGRQYRFPHNGELPSPRNQMLVTPLSVYVYKSHLSCPTWCLRDEVLGEAELCSGSVAALVMVQLVQAEGEGDSGLPPSHLGRQRTRPEGTEATPRRGVRAAYRARGLSQRLLIKAARRRTVLKDRSRPSHAIQSMFLGGTEAGE